MNELQQYYGNYFQGAQSVAAAGTNAVPANDPAQNPSGTTSGGEQVEKSGQINASGNVFGWWLALIGIFVALTFAVEKFDSGSTFGNVKLSFYNSMVIGLNAVLFIALGKYIFTKFPVPGLGAVFQSV